MRRVFVPAILVALTACGDSGGGFVVGQQAVEDCPITEDLASLDNTVWVMDEAQPEGNRLNPQARVKFIREGDQVSALYTVKSGFDVYTYECDPISGGTEYACFEPARVRDWCQAMEVYEPESCRLERMKEMGATKLTDEEINKAIDEAKKMVAKYRNTENWTQFRNNNNNMGNKLRGMLYAKPNKTRCNLRVQDMYMTIYNGSKLEDSNPVGTNPFAISTEEFLWDHCDNGNTLADAQSSTKPGVDEVDPGKYQHETGKPVWYHYFGDEALKPEEGCTYSYDLYAQWRPISQDNAVTAGEDGKLIWMASHTYKVEDHTDWFNPKLPQGITAMVRNKTCAGKKEKIDTICNTAKVMPMAAE